MPCQYLEIENAGQTRIISINRPEVYGALNRQAKMELLHSLQEAQEDSTLRSVILASRGKAFCSGQDLGDRRPDSAPSDLGTTLEEEWNPLIEGIRKSRLPVIAAVSGVCAGAGLSVVLACDFIVSAPGVKFVSGFAALNLVPDAGSSFALTRALGYYQSLRFFTGQEALAAEGLHEAGIIARISGDPLTSAKEIGEGLNGMAPAALAQTKKNLQMALEESFEQTLGREVAAQRRLGQTHDHREGLAAFFEKRSPQFRGN